jgi:UDPglucose 6-dehydrogenase
MFKLAYVDRLRRVMAPPVIVDLRNVYRADEMKRANFQYFGVGRPESAQKIARLS